MLNINGSNCVLQSALLLTRTPYDSHHSHACQHTSCQSAPLYQSPQLMLVSTTLLVTIAHFSKHSSCQSAPPSQSVLFTLGSNLLVSTNASQNPACQYLFLSALCQSAPPLMLVSTPLISTFLPCQSAASMLLCTHAGQHSTSQHPPHASHHPPCYSAPAS